MERIALTMRLCSMRPPTTQSKGASITPTGFVGGDYAGKQRLEYAISPLLSNGLSRFLSAIDHAAVMRYRLNGVKYRDTILELAIPSPFTEKGKRAMFLQCPRRQPGRASTVTIIAGTSWQR